MNDLDKVFLTDISECYYSLANIELAMNYYNLYETCTINPNGPEKNNIQRLAEFDSLRKSVEELIKQLYEDREETINEAYNLRNEIKRRMEIISDYADRFSLYEYIINRIEPRFTGEVRAMDNDATARELLQLIFQTNDNIVINDNIKAMVSQLPIRMTKDRFFNIVDNVFKQYAGLSRMSFDKTLYIIISAAGITDPKKDEFFKELFNADSELSNLDYDILGKEEYEFTKSLLKKNTRIIIDSMDILNYLAEIVNLICVILLNRSSVEDAVKKETKGYLPVIEAAEKGFAVGMSDEMSEDILAIFKQFEGRLEYNIERLQQFEMKLERYYEKACSEKNEQQKIIIEEKIKSQKLMSASIFVELDEKEDEITDSLYIDSKIKEVTKQLTDVFGTDTKIMSRARMAAVFRELPVFFNSRTEVMNYVRESLDRCGDEGEKLVAVRLIKDSIITEN